MMCVVNMIEYSWEIGLTQTNETEFNLLEIIRR